jgi:antitoxin MazE
MELQISKWGNSLALRLPAALAKDIGVSEGSHLSTKELGERLLAIQDQAQEAVSATRKTLAERLRALHKSMPLTRPVSKDEMSRY